MNSNLRVFKKDTCSKQKKKNNGKRINRTKNGNWRPDWTEEYTKKIKLGIEEK